MVYTNVMTTQRKKFKKLGDGKKEGKANINFILQPSAVLETKVRLLRCDPA